MLSRPRITNESIELRDGVRLHARVYAPNDSAPRPIICILTPYLSDTYHPRGMYFANQGFVFVIADARGRGESEGDFAPLIQEATDAFDLIAWAANHPLSNGKVAMWGGSYNGYVQWAAAKEFPPALRAIVPAAAPTIGVDFPMRHNIGSSYAVQWLHYTWGRTAQQQLRSDTSYWASLFAEWHASGAALCDFDLLAGERLAPFQEWVRHPSHDSYWNTFNPTNEDYRRINLPILTITGIYDTNQLGALTHYRAHICHASEEAKGKHFLIIGPWDHDATRTPRVEIGGLVFDEASLIDLNRLHADWYTWALDDGPLPEFLHDKVAYYLPGAEIWRYAASLEAVTPSTDVLYITSTVNADDVFRAGSLKVAPGSPSSDQYTFEPTDIQHLTSELMPSTRPLMDQRATLARSGRALFYHSEPMAEACAVAGFFRFSAWISIDQPDADFYVDIYEVLPDNTCIFLTGDALRARYRESRWHPALCNTTEPRLYEFQSFDFTARLLSRGSRLRLILSSLNSLISEKNRGSGGSVAMETDADARAIQVRLHHGGAHPTALHVPLAEPLSEAHGSRRGSR